LSEKKIHIIAFDVPYPPNYGGIIDVFYKLKSLHNIGAKVIYHCFFYKDHNPPTTILEEYCEEIHYYRRNESVLKLLFSNKPYIVSSRSDKRLLTNLLQDNAPILFDGIQTTYYFDHPKLSSRKKIFRAHNIEHDYYQALSEIEPSWIKRFYLKYEAKKLGKFEKILTGADAILSIAKMDVPHFSQYGKTLHIPPFFCNKKDVIPCNKINQKIVLFHGNLAVKENEFAALFILEKIAPLTNHKIVIAGNNPSSVLSQKISTIDTASLVVNPSIEVMDELVQQAHINLLITFQQTGVKLKLLHALSLGKHVIINEKMDDSSLFKTLCSIKNSPDEIAKTIDALMETPFDQKDQEKRNQIFLSHFDNNSNAIKIRNLI